MKAGKVQAISSGRELNPEPWTRLEDETDKSFESFTIYRNLGPSRSLPSVRDSLGRPAGYDRQLEEWSSKYAWVERAGAWDEYVDRTTRTKALEEISAMRTRHAEEAVALQAKAIEKLKGLNLDDLSPGDLLRFIVEGAKLERLARGEPESVHELRGSEDREAYRGLLGDPEVRELASRVAKKLVRRPGEDHAD